MRFSKRKLHFLFSLFLCWRNRNKKKKKRKKRKWKRPKNPIKIVFLRWSSKNVKNQKKWIFLAKIAWHYLCQEGRKTRIFVHTICFGQNFFWTKTVQSRKHYKIGVSAELQKSKMTPFFGKGCFFDMAEKVRFTNYVFEKLCFPESAIFIVFSAKDSSSKTKTVCWKDRKFMKNSGLFLNMAKWCFLGLFFEVLILKGLFLVCLALFQKC